MKKSLIIIFILLLTILSTGLIFFLKKDKTIEYEKNIVIMLEDELPDTISYKLDNKDKKANIVWNDKITKKVGKYSGSFMVNEKEYVFNLEIKDNIPPSINGVKDLQTTVGNDIDLLKNITTKDNSNEEIQLKVEGNYDFNTPNEYELTYVAIDSSNNIAKEKFMLIVKEESQSYSSHIVGQTSKGYNIELRDNVYYINDILIANKSYPLPKSYAPGFDKNASVAYSKLVNSAKEDGIVIFTLNSYRSYTDQYIIYNDYVKNDSQENADRYSARPGYSEHQSGLAIDVNSLSQDFGNTKEGKWLNDNAYKYGFILRYLEGKEDITGYMYEPWHIRYVGEKLAKILYNDGSWITLEEYLGITSKYD